MIWYQRFQDRRRVRNTKSQWYNGNHYHSKMEAAYAQELDLRIKAKDIKGWERQIKCSLDVYGKHICDYFVDFKIYHNDGSIELVEVKGFPTDLWRFKWKLFEAIWNKKHRKIKLSVVT